MNRSAVRYKNRLKQHLQCSHAAKTQLLRDFSKTLHVFLEEHPDAAFGDFYSAFGPPEEMAAVLSAQISEKEARSYGIRKNVRRMLAGLVIVLLTLATVYMFFYKETPVISECEVRYVGEIPGININTEGK